MFNCPPDSNSLSFNLGVPTLHIIKTFWTYATMLADFDPSLLVCSCVKITARPAGDPSTMSSVSSFGVKISHNCVTFENFFEITPGFFTFTGPLKVDIFLGQHSQRSDYWSQIWDLLLDVVYDSQKRSNLVLICGSSSFFNCIDFLWIWCNSLFTEGVAEKIHRWFKKWALFLVQSQSLLLQSLQSSSHMFFMFIITLTGNDDVIWDVTHPFESLKHLLYNLLKFFTGSIDSKIQLFEPM